MHILDHGTLSVFICALKNTHLFTHLITYLLVYLSSYAQCPYQPQHREVSLRQPSSVVCLSKASHAFKIDVVDGLHFAEGVFVVDHFRISFDDKRQN